jgi:hypothetical protein
MGVMFSWRFRLDALPSKNSRAREVSSQVRFSDELIGAFDEDLILG